MTTIPAGLPERVQHFIAGEFVDSVSGETFDVLEPTTNTTYIQCASGDKADVDAAARAVVAGSGFGGTQASRVAYSVGIAVPPDWGEGNILSIKPREERTLQANMTFHLLPWVQIPGKGGVGCTETIRVTETGCELLTDLPRELFVK